MVNGTPLAAKEDFGQFRELMIAHHPEIGWYYAVGSGSHETRLARLMTELGMGSTEFDFDAGSQVLASLVEGSGKCWYWGVLSKLLQRYGDDSTHKTLLGCFIGPSAAFKQPVELPAHYDGEHHLIDPASREESAPQWQDGRGDFCSRDLLVSDQSGEQVDR